MRRTCMVWLAMAAVGCGGIEQDEFVSAYTEHYCEAWLSCGEQATHVFDGIDTVEECRALEGDALTASWQGCKYKKKKAKQCLESLADPVCPDGDDLTVIFPVICDEVWVKCVGPASEEADASIE